MSPHPAAYNFNYWVCESCAHTWASPPDVEAPSRCENCGDADLAGFVGLDDAENYSQEILDGRS